MASADTPSSKSTPSTDTAAPRTPSHPGMMGDGTEEQNLDQPGDPKARITEAEVTEAFGTEGDATAKR